MNFSDEPTVRPIGGDELVTVSYVLPARLATKFQREAGAVLDRLHRIDAEPDFDLAIWQSSGFAPPYNSNHRGDESAWTFPPITWDDRKAVAWAVDNWTDTGRSLVAGLLLAPAAGVHTFDLAEAVGYTGGLPSAFRAIVGRLRAIERAPFWRGDPDTLRHERGQLLAPDRGADVVRRILEIRHPAVFATNGRTR
ncbi:MAG TPA: hypothetical protein VH419_00845 [Nocardioidaceae bacterium]